MASAKTVAMILSSIKSVYPYYSKGAESSVLAKIWETTLKNYPDDIVQASFMECLKTCKMPPTPADVIGKVNTFLNAEKPSAEELWAKFVKSLRKVQNDIYDLQFPRQRADAINHIQAVYDSMPIELRKYAGSRGEFQRMADYGDDELKFEKNKFLKAIPQIMDAVQIQKTFESYGISGEVHKMLNE